MKTLATALMNDDKGMIVSAELAIVLTVSVLAMVVGLNGVAGSVSSELNDLSSAFGTLDQSFTYRGMTKFNHSWVAGSGYFDTRDFCDCTAIWRTTSIGKVGHYGAAYGVGAVTTAPVQGPTLVNPCPTGDCVPALTPPCDHCEVNDQPVKPAQDAPIPAPITEPTPKASPAK